MSTKNVKITFSNTTKKRTAISLETKYEIIEKSSKGAKTSELAVQFEKSTSTISTILKEKEKIIKDTTSRIEPI